MIQLVGVSKSYDGRPALHPTDLSVAAGRTTVLLGPSGCGKSTLLRLMVGLIRPDRGAVLFDGTPVHAGNVRALRRRMGYVIQEGGLFPHLTLRENVTLAARYLGRSRAAIDARLQTLTALMRLSDALLDRYPVQLSGGQRQRAGLMRALMLDPDVLLLDEPLGALDPMIRAELQDDLLDAFQTLNKTVVLVTHDLAEAVHFADTIVLLRAGRVVQAGPFEALAREPADPFVTAFIRAQRRTLPC